LFNRIAFTALCLTFMSSSALGAITFTPLGDLPGGSSSSFAYDVSADGSVVGYSSGTSGNGAFRWTAAGGMQGLGDLGGGGFGSAAHGISGDGSTVVGEGNSSSGYEAFIWTAGGGIQGLGDFPGGSYQSIATGVSRDGSTVVGQGSSSLGGMAFRWTASGGMQGLGDLQNSNASDVSDDGSAVVGMVSSEAYRWTAAAGAQRLGDLTGGASYSNATGISGDGSTVVGESYSSSGLEAFRWTIDGGMRGLGDLEGGIFQSYATAASGDGSKVVGQSRGYFGNEAFIWDEVNGMQRLADVLTAGGADLTGWYLTDANAISADGRYIVGTGQNPAYQTEAWLVDLRAPTISDPVAVPISQSPVKVTVLGGTAGSSPGGLDADFEDPVATAGDFQASYETVGESEFSSSYAGTSGFDLGNFLTTGPGGDFQVWDLDFTGMIADGGRVTLQFKYDDEGMSSLQEDMLGIWHYGQYGPNDERQWQWLRDSIDTVGNIITITTDNFSPFAPGFQAAASVTPEPSQLLIWGGIALCGALAQRFRASTPRR
jgi:probable HAF family extracellular repeat protein